jgi:protease PrsW
VFLWGLGLWVAATLALVLTRDDVLLPSVVLIGSFLVPVSAVFWFLDHDRETELSAGRLYAAFFVAGVLGLITAAVLETWLVPSRALPNLWVGLIEEAVKGLGVIALARPLHRYTIHDGVLLGATVGLGFGAFEAAGYTLSYGVSPDGFSIQDMLSEEILRAVIAPFCHGVWTGLFGAALFAAHGRITLGVVAVYLGVSLLHALWDAASTAGIVITVLASGTDEQRDALATWDLPTPSTLDAEWLYGLVEWGVMIVVALAGVLLLHRLWSRQAARA